MSSPYSAGDNNHHSKSTTPGGRSGSGSGREDCWSEGATAVLIEAWGERHLRCNRGNLRQNDWAEVADAVNGRGDGSKPPKSDVQCKNRIDTLKKKYKIEKGRNGNSNWRFFNRMDYLIVVPAGKKFGGGGSGGTKNQQQNRFRLNNSTSGGPSPNLSTAQPNSNARLSGLWSSSSRLNSAESSDESCLRSGGENNGGSDLVGRGRKHGRSDEESRAFGELAKAIVKFGEIYERIERSKQNQMMELEKQRMEFTKEVEFQRMNMLMNAQLEIEKLKRAKNASTTTTPAGKKL